jgi:serine/threonine protein kinase
LKTARVLAPAAFVDRFQKLQERLEAWSHPSLVAPRRAWVDSEGHPSMLTDFRQGVPLLDRVRDGRLSADAGRAMLARLKETLKEGHARGLIHGSVVPGNVLVDSAGTCECLLDFGFRALLASSESLALSATHDETAFDVLEQALSNLARPAKPVP